MGVGQGLFAGRGVGRPRDEALGLRRQEEILGAAAKLFARDGYNDTTTQALADLLQVGKGTIYRYFPTKRQLFLAAVDRMMWLLRETIESQVAGIDDPLRRIAKAIETYLAFFAEHPESVELLIQERAQFKDREKPTYFQHRDATVERLWVLFRRLIAAGRMRDIPVEQAADVMNDLVYGTMFTNYFTGRRRSPSEQAKDIMDLFFLGILSESERRAQGAEVNAEC
jgi:AcrR family transcriptional regulator